ncbi:MAG: putative lipoprotein [Verrucomicrobiales bacterium]|nr:putative lipoprotein [Verrucomicrobiales bacterium]
MLANTLKKRLVIAALGVVLVFVSCVYALLRSTPADRFSHALNAAVEEHRDSGGIQLRRLTEIPWERLHIFGPYTSPEQVNAALGFPWRDRHLTKIGMMDDRNLLVFTAGGKVVLSVLHPRHEADFSQEALNRSFTPEDAVLTADHLPDGRMELRPAAK